MAYVKKESRVKRKFRIRKKVFGTAERPRMSIFKSNKHLYVQVIDDTNQKTIAQASTQKEKKGANIEAAKWLGQTIAERVKATSVAEVVFDRNGFQYHGVVRQIADSAREGGLKF